MNNQPNLFEDKIQIVEIDKVLLYALGEFQSRGKILAKRELALDRLRGAFKRAAEKFNLKEFSDDEIAKGLENLRVKVTRVPSFVAKHPFRITVNDDIAEQAKIVFREALNND